MKTTILLILLMPVFASTSFASDWVCYLSNDVVEAYYNRDTRLGNSATVRWVYKKKTEYNRKDFRVHYRFTAYCSTRQMFSVETNEALQEVELSPGSLYEVTYKMICGER